MVKEESEMAEKRPTFRIYSNDSPTPALPEEQKSFIEREKKKANKVLADLRAEQAKLMEDFQNHMKS